MMEFFLRSRWGNDRRLLVSQVHCRRPHHSTRMECLRCGHFHRCCPSASCAKLLLLNASWPFQQQPASRSPSCWIQYPDAAYHPWRGSSCRPQIEWWTCVCRWYFPLHKMTVSQSKQMTPKNKDWNTHGATLSAMPVTDSFVCFTEDFEASRVMLSLVSESCKRRSGTSHIGHVLSETSLRPSPDMLALFVCVLRWGIAGCSGLGGRLV